ncbi:MAG TPA: trehalase family glycosidase, partial [Candidatus Methylacidiphilales bacterium]
PYTVPSPKGVFQELYYWDTYFTCIGLLHSGKHRLALDNTRNLLSEVARFGYVPNGNRTYYLTRSQPPFLAPLVEAVAAALPDVPLREEALPLLRREYAFWMEHRATPAGLARHGHQADRAALLAFAPEIAALIGLPDDPGAWEAALPLLSHKMAECETGWDFNPRFENRCEDFCPVDLNSLLYLYERFFADHGAPGEKAAFSRRAEERRERLAKLCWDAAEGGFFDYDFRNERRSRVASAANFHALWAGLATAKQAAAIAERIVPRLELPFGLASCARAEAEGPGAVRPQWGWPNSWPCIQLLAYTGLHRYGHEEAALRIAEKYLAAVARVFSGTGELWEKYNAVDGSTHTVNENGYIVADRAEGGAPEGAPSMMGWTAGVFLDALAFRRRITGRK